MLAVVLRAIVIMPAIPPVIAPTVSVSSPRFTAVKTASFLYFSASPFHSGSAPFWLLFGSFFCSSFNMPNFWDFWLSFSFFLLSLFSFCAAKMYSKKQPASPAAIRRSLYAASFTFSSFLVSFITPSFLSSLSRYSSTLSYVSYVYLTVISL